MAQITKDTLIVDILQSAPECSASFSIHRHALLGCAMASGETVEEACAVHGVDAEAFLEQLNELVEEKN